MFEDSLLNGDCLARLVAADGAATPAWFTRMHLEVQRLCPGEFVFRLGEELDDLLRWMEGAGAQMDDNHPHGRITFDSDRDKPRFYGEGGRVSFRWNGCRYRVFAVRVQGPRYDQTYAWVACPDHAAADALVDAVGRHTGGRHSKVMVFEDGDWEEAPRLVEDLTGYCWESVVLPDATRSRIRTAAELFFRSEGVYRDLDIPWKMGLLFVGPPGTGKTLTTKVLASTTGVPFLYVRGLNGFCGNEPTHQNLREMFQGARERGPCVLCLEDVDSLVTEDLRSAFLNELDGLEEDYRGVLTVATTNHPEKLDAALLHRPSRFDYRIEFPLPDGPQRRAFAGHWVEKLARLGYVEAPEAAVEEIVRRSQGMSHAYLKRVLVGTVMRMHSLDERGDAAFLRIVLEELADATQDRAVGRRAESSNGSANGVRVGFRLEQ